MHYIEGTIGAIEVSGTPTFAIVPNSQFTLDVDGGIRHLFLDEGGGPDAKSVAAKGDKDQQLLWFKTRDNGDEGLRKQLFDYLLQAKVGRLSARCHIIADSLKNSGGNPFEAILVENIRFF